jgi:hypothetical protein
MPRPIGSIQEGIPNPAVAAEPNIRRDGRVKDCQAVVRLLRVNGRTRMRFLVAA